ncbi:MAG: helix-turn-helix domain-containing protein [Chromatocurvus sp.]
MAFATPHVTQHPAASDLSPFVHRIMHGAGIDGERCELRIPPRGGVFLSYVPGSPLVVHFSDRVYAEQPRFFIGGQLREERPVLRSTDRFELVGVELTPTGYYKLFQRPANLLTDGIADMAALHPSFTAHLAESIDEQRGIRGIIAAFETAIRRQSQQAVSAPVVDSLVHEIMRHNGVVSVGALFEQHEMTPRQLRRYFEQVVGVPAKYFAKICQVNSIIAAMLANDGDQLRSLAMDHGFYDQSHFIRDFQTFVAMDPGAFLRDESQFLRTYLGSVSRPDGPSPD